MFAAGGGSGTEVLVATSSHAVAPINPRPVAVIAVMVGIRLDSGIILSAHRSTAPNTAANEIPPVQNFREANRVANVDDAFI